MSRALIILLLQGLVLAPDIVGGLVVEFSGKEFVSFSIAERIGETSYDTSFNKLIIGFKTIHPSGTLFFGSGSNGDYIAVLLLHGKLLVSINLCPESLETCHLSVVMGDNLCDNALHTMHLIREGKEINITLGHHKYHGIIPGSHLKLNLDWDIYVAGMPMNIKADAVFQVVRQIPNFQGCLQSIHFDYLNVLKSAYTGERFSKIIGSPVKDCKYHGYSPIGFPNSSFVQVIRLPPKRTLMVSMAFRSYIGKGTLMVASTNVSRAILALESGRIVFTVISHMKWKREHWKRKLPIGNGLGDGEWHEVTAYASSRKVAVKVDDLERVTAYLLKPYSRFGHFNSIQIGDPSNGFLGCLNKLKINRIKIGPNHLHNPKDYGVMVGKCALDSHCFPNPCENAGKCLQTYKGFQCDCRGTLYAGSRCSRPIAKSTCGEYVEYGLTNDTVCLVDADREGVLQPFEVLCSKSITGEPMSVVTHMRNGTQRITAADVIVEPVYNLNKLKYFHKVTYATGMQNIKALIGQSVRCRQHVSLYCFKSKLVNGPRGTAEAMWVSRDAVLRHFKGGAYNASDSICACGLQDNCKDPSKVCNCDVGNDKWHEDAGYIKDKSLLPVVSLAFSSTARSSLYTLGPLECFGTVNYSKGLPSDDLKDVGYPLYSVCKLHPREQQDVTDDTDFGALAFQGRSRAFASSSLPAGTSQPISQLRNSQPKATRHESNIALPTERLEIPQEKLEEVDKDVEVHDPFVGKKIKNQETYPRGTSQITLSNSTSFTAETDGNGQTGKGTRESEGLGDTSSASEMSFEILLMLIVVLTLVPVSVVMLTVILLILKRKGTCSWLSSSNKSKVKERAARDSYFGDSMVKPPIPDPWMTYNACGYNVTTGKITYGSASSPV